MLPSQQEWADFYAQVKRATGLDFAHYKANQLQRRILSMAESKNVLSLSDFWQWLNSDKDNLRWFLDKMAINVSELFRNPEKWDELRTKVIPELLARSKTLKCWSAGCSYGAEAHTLAMILDRNYSGQHTITGSDIDDAALNQAREGRFSDADVRNVPVDYRSRYLTKNGESWTADAKLKKYLDFRKSNLLADKFESGYDLILCRNVVIYFTDEAKDTLYRRFYEALKPGGVLFIGSTERIFGSQQIGFESFVPFFYKKPVLRDQQWRNAS